MPEESGKREDANPEVHFGRTSCPEVGWLANLKLSLDLFGKLVVNTPCWRLPLRLPRLLIVVVVILCSVVPLLAPSCKNIRDAQLTPLRYV